MLYCRYYQAQIKRELSWFFTATFRAHEHMGFDRTLDTQNSLFEFFIPPQYEKQFLAFMKDMEQRGISENLITCENRLKHSDFNS